MRIYTDDNGVAVNAISKTVDGVDVDGHLYNVLAGSNTTVLEFQMGGVQEVGVNGITTEGVLAALIHRTNVLNTRFPCRENALAITNLEQALMWLEKRTKNRKERCVEGRLTP